MANGYVATYGSEPSSRKMSLEMTAEEGSETHNILRDEREQHEDDQRQLKIVNGSQETQVSGSWWNSLSNTDAVPTPTAARFHHVENVKELGGFISLMDDPALPMTPSVTTSSHQKVESIFDNEGDDLGLGNSTHKRTQDEPTKMTEDKPPPASAQDAAKGDEKRGKLQMGPVSW